MRILSILKYTRIREGTLIASELLCSADAVSINYESDDDVFKPIKCSDCQINVS